MKPQTTLWQHGAGAKIEHPSQALLLRHTGNALRVVGVAGSTNWLHYPLALHHELSEKNGVKLLHLRLRYRCDSQTALITNIAVFDAEQNVYKAAGLNLCAYDWEEVVLTIDKGIAIQHGLNISIGIRFDGADDDTHALEISGVGVDIVS